MALSRATSWSDTTEVSASASPARLKAVIVDIREGSAAESYIQLWDVADPTPGTTAPRMVLPIPRNAVMGGRYRIKFPFPGGMVFGTALTWFVSTTHDGATAATTSAPLAVEVHYELL